jgi:hypothetical protein
LIVIHKSPDNSVIKTEVSETAQETFSENCNIPEVTKESGRCHYNSNGTTECQSQVKFVWHTISNRLGLNKPDTASAAVRKDEPRQHIPRTIQGENPETGSPECSESEALNHHPHCLEANGEIVPESLTRMKTDPIARREYHTQNVCHRWSWAQRSKAFPQKRSSTSETAIVSQTNTLAKPETESDRLPTSKERVRHQDKELGHKGWEAEGQ